MSSLDFFHIDTGMNLKLLWFMHLPCLALEMFIYEHRFAFHFVWIGSSESWNWHREDYCLQKDPNSGKFLFCFIICLLVCILEIGMFELVWLFWADISECLWNGVPQNEEDLSYMLDETTPIKACGDLAYHVSHSGIFFPSSLVFSRYLVT